jgi:hypothetical protein
MTNNDEPQKEVLGVVGIGLDSKDGHQRITRNEDVLLLGGSQETHDHLQEISIRFNESLRERGKRLRDTQPDEVIELLFRAVDD